MFTRSAELLKHTNAGWAPADSLRFQNMLTSKKLANFERRNYCALKNLRA
jgi:hypothetical protein